MSCHIRLSASTASRTYELSEETHVTPFRTYRFYSTGLCNYKPQGQTYRKTFAVGRSSRFISTGPSRMFSVLMEGCHVGYSREFIGWVYCTCGQLNMTIGSIKKKRILVWSMFWLKVTVSYWTGFVLLLMPVPCWFSTRSSAAAILTNA